MHLLNLVSLLSGEFQLAFPCISSQILSVWSGAMMTLISFSGPAFSCWWKLATASQGDSGERGAWKSDQWEARWDNENGKEEKEDGKSLRAGGLALVIVSISYFHIYKAHTFYDYAAIQNDIKAPSISCWET